MLSIEQQYLSYAKLIENDGATKPVNGEEHLTVRSIVGAMLNHNFKDGFPIYSSKRVWWKGAIGEMLWFLGGEGNISALRAMGIKIWDNWAFKAEANKAKLEKHNKLLADADKFTEQAYLEAFDCLLDPLPLHYTNMTSWQDSAIDQTDWVLTQLPIKPFRKSYLVSCWDPSTVYHMADMPVMAYYDEKRSPVVLPACHFAHQLLCNSKNRLSMVVYIRSNDWFLGNPFNVAQYGALLEMYCLCLSNRTGEAWQPDELVLQIGDAHIYSNHGEAFAEMFEQSEVLCNGNVGKAKLNIANRGQVNLQQFELSDFSMENYLPEGTIKAGLHTAGGF